MQLGLCLPPGTSVGAARNYSSSAGIANLLLNHRSQSWLLSEAERWYLSPDALVGCTSIELLLFTSSALKCSFATHRQFGSPIPELQAFQEVKGGNSDPLHRTDETSPAE